MWNFPRVFNLIALLVTCKISFMSTMGAMECPLSVRCCANFDRPILCLKSRKSLEILCETVCWFVQFIFYYSLGMLVGKHRIYCIYYNWYFLLWIRNFLIVLSALKDIFSSEFLNSLVMIFFCRPTYTNLAHFVFVFVLTSLLVFYQLCGWFYLKSLHVTYYYAIFALLCRTLFSHLFYLWGMLKDDWPSI